MNDLAPPLNIGSLESIVGSVIGGKYRIDGVLGEGGMGVVLHATHLELDSTVAIKVVRTEFAGNEEVVERMLFEARNAAKLRSAHVVRVLDVARLPSGSPYLVMERLEGCDLATLLTSRGALPVTEAVDFVLQACEALAEAHALGIIHRDLKPENLFVADTPEGRLLKVLDFGISKDVSGFTSAGPRRNLTRTGSALGSPFYMAPEQMRAALDIDARADIWSLGAILFELLTGKCPFEAESVAVVCSKVLTEEPASLVDSGASVPAELQAIVSHCLQKDPHARFDRVEALSSALRGFASAAGQLAASRGERTAATVPGPHGVTRRIDIDVDARCSSPTLLSQMHHVVRTRSLEVAVSLLRPKRHRVWGAAVLAAALALFGVSRLLSESPPARASSAPKTEPAPRPPRPAAEPWVGGVPPGPVPVVTVGTVAPGGARLVGSSKRVGAGALRLPRQPIAAGTQTAAPATPPIRTPAAGAAPSINDPERLGGRY